MAAWIDLAVPYCGDYIEANAWTEDELQYAKRRIELRKKAEEIDLKNIAEYTKVE